MVLLKAIEGGETTHFSGMMSAVPNPCARNLGDEGMLRLVKIFSVHFGGWSPVVFLLGTEFSVVVLNVASCPIGLVAASRFKMLDSQSGSANVGSVSICFHDFAADVPQKIIFWIISPPFFKFICLPRL